MDFKIFLAEMAYAMLSPPYEINNGVIEHLDMHVEHWDIDENNPNAGDVVKLKRQIMSLINVPEFYGLLPNGQYLYHDGKNIYRFQILEHKPTSGINLDSLEALKCHWWRYTAGIDHDNNVVKMPDAECNPRPELYQPSAAAAL